MLKLARPKVSVNLVKLYTVRVVAVWTLSLDFIFSLGIWFLRPSTINKSMRVRTRKKNQLFLFVCNSGSVPEFSPSSCPHIYSSCSFLHVCHVPLHICVCVYICLYTHNNVIYYYNI